MARIAYEAYLWTFLTVWLGNGPAGAATPRDPDQEGYSSMATQTIAQETRAGDGFFAAGRERLRTREERALALHREHGREIEQVAKNLFWVPSQDAQREHLVRYPVGPGRPRVAPAPTTNSGT
jgi:hypothetical protein